MTIVLDESVFISPLAPVVSLDALFARDNPEALAFDIAEPFVPIEDRLQDDAGRLAVLAFVDELPPKQRDILIRVFWRGEPQAAVAKAHGVSGAAISKTINKVFKRGRRKLLPYRDSFTASN